MGKTNFFICIILSCFSSVSLGIVGAIPSSIPRSHPAYYNTVALVKKEGPTHFKVFCTGVILSKKHIMTAKHCLGMDDKKLSDFFIYFGSDTNNIDRSLLRQPIAMSSYGSSEWKIFFPSFDVALIELKELVPNADGKNWHLPHFRSVPILENPNLLMQAKKIHLAGYGNQSTKLMEVIAGEKKRVGIGFKKYIDTPQISSVVVLEGEQGHSNCHGDSGGPAYALIADPKTGKDKWYIFGTAAGFDIALTPKSYRKLDDKLFPYVALCGGAQTIYSFIGDYVSWLEEVSQESLISRGISRELAPGIFDLSTSGTENDFRYWCEKSDFQSKEWLTVRQMLIFAMEKEENSYTQSEILLNCDKAEEVLNSITKMRFSENEIFDSLKPLATIKSLQDVEFVKTKIPNLLPLVGSSIDSITLRGLSVDSLESVPGLLKNTQLVSLKLPENNLTDLDNLSILNKLEVLDFSSNKITYLEELSEMNNLKEVDFFDNLVEDMGPLLNLDLEVLIASRNQLKSPLLFSDDTVWPNLRIVLLADNQLEDLEFLRASFELEEVIVSGNKIKSLAPIRDKKIKILRTRGNPLEPASRQ